MLATLIQNGSPLSESNDTKQFLVVLPKLDKSLEKFQKKHVFFGKNILETVLLRRKMKPEEICGAPVKCQSQEWCIVCMGHGGFE